MLFVCELCDSHKTFVVTLPLQDQSCECENVPNIVLSSQFQGCLLKSLYLSRIQKITKLLKIKRWSIFRNLSINIHIP